MMVLQWVPYIDNYPVLVTYCHFAFFYFNENSRILRIQKFSFTMILSLSIA